MWKELYRGGGHIPGIRKENIDGSSAFRAFNLASMPSTFIVAHHNIPCLAPPALAAV
jgi:hypothetical protein